MKDLSKQFLNDISTLDRKVIFTLVYTSFGLSCIYYLKDANVAWTIFKAFGLENIGKAITDLSATNIGILSWWAFVVTVFYLIIPAAVIKFYWKESLKDYGLKFGIEEGFGKLLAFCLAIMLPLVWLMSMTEGFAAKYPFLKIYNGDPYIGTTFIIWQLLYFLQFFGLEFFFRGFLVQSLKPRLGLYSILVMTVPYCMIHFGKPPAETFAAIFAGIFLGWLSYRNGSIWLGLILHCSVALLMDLFALYAKGLLLF